MTVSDQPLQCPFCLFTALVTVADPLCPNCGLALSRTRIAMASGPIYQPAIAPPAAAGMLVHPPLGAAALEGTRGQLLEDPRVVAAPRCVWMLELEDGRRFELAARDVLVGRRPASTVAATLQIDDATETLSSSHARLRWDRGRWTVEDLHSTYGVSVLVTDREIVAPPGVATPVQEYLRLGTLHARIVTVTALLIS